ncbi:hypothetical protein JTE90_007340 [Oedothorax gibbosus]|uniref:Uncharacterized protein n=1 Tax=Oedothorax gibbosus TaxID=931172 RepID=A0AAV6TQT4_9ARAC|nr:hypothetical protein JTE90_007340 [Oedothorax gibbosus]
MAPSKKSCKRKRVVLTLAQKLDIIRRIEKGERKEALMAEFNIGSSTIYDLKKKKTELAEFIGTAETEKAVDTRKTLRQPKLTELDKVLYEWFTLKRLEGAPISGPMLMEKGKELHLKME